jgi:general secretion pathway protein M
VKWIEMVGRDGRLSRAFAVSLLLMLLSMPWLLIARPLRQTIADNDLKLQADAAALSRYKGIAAYASRLDQQAPLDDLVRSKPDFLTGEQDALILADLQSRLRSVIVGNSSELMSASVLPVRTVGALTVLGLKIQIRGQLADIQRIIHTIESNTPHLWIGQAQLGLEQRQIPGNAAPTSRQGRILAAELNVFGAKWPEGAAVGRKP